MAQVRDDSGVGVRMGGLMCAGISVSNDGVRRGAFWWSIFGVVGEGKVNSVHWRLRFLV